MPTHTLRRTSLPALLISFPPPHRQRPSPIPPWHKPTYLAPRCARPRSSPPLLNLPLRSSQERKAPEQVSSPPSVARRASAGRRVSPAYLAPSRPPSCSRSGRPQWLRLAQILQTPPRRAMRLSRPRPLSLGGRALPPGASSARRRTLSPRARPSRRPRRTLTLQYNRRRARKAAKGRVRSRAGRRCLRVPVRGIRRSGLRPRT